MHTKDFSIQEERIFDLLECQFMFCVTQSFEKLNKPYSIQKESSCLCVVVVVTPALMEIINKGKILFKGDILFTGM